MRLLVQRVKRAQVKRVLDNKVVGQIDEGLFVLAGIKRGDSPKDVEMLAAKLSRLRVMADKSGKMNLSVNDAKAEILIVSQFTLYANTLGGNRPSFLDAEDPAKAKVLYELLVENIGSHGIKTETGSFGDYMQIEAVLDGPVTIELES